MALLSVQNFDDVGFKANVRLLISFFQNGPFPASFSLFFVFSTHS